MRWIFCTTEKSIENETGFNDLIKVAVITAQKYTKLQPTMIYYGESFDLPLIKWLQDRGVTILKAFPEIGFELLTLEESAARFDRGVGSLLKLEIHRVLNDEHLPEDYVLYTDCDVMFTPNFKLPRVKPKLLAGTPEYIKDDWGHIDTGVMLLNNFNLLNRYNSIARFFIENYRPEWDWEQDGYNQLEWDKLDQLYNWKPYWGKNSEAKIVHFHRLKPYMDMIPTNLRQYSGPNSLYPDSAFEEYRQQWYLELTS